MPHNAITGKPERFTIRGSAPTALRAYPGIYRFQANPDENLTHVKRKAALVKNGPSVLAPPRRSGRVPALPYPPGGVYEYSTRSQIKTKELEKLSLSD